VVSDALVEEAGRGPERLSSETQADARGSGATEESRPRLHTALGIEGQLDGLELGERRGEVVDKPPVQSNAEIISRQNLTSEVSVCGLFADRTSFPALTI
jgi:hypothetical protein